MQEMMEINVDHVAMELYELVAPIPKAVWHGALAGNLNILNMLKSVNCDFNESDQVWGDWSVTRANDPSHGPGVGQISVCDMLIIYIAISAP